MSTFGKWRALTMQTSRPVAACDLPAEAPSPALLRALSRLGDKALATRLANPRAEPMARATGESPLESGRRSDSGESPGSEIVRDMGAMLIRRRLRMPSVVLRADSACGDDFESRPSSASVSAASHVVLTDADGSDKK